jgi:putative copper export protein
MVTVMATIVTAIPTKNTTTILMGTIIFIVNPVAITGHTTHSHGITITIQHRFMALLLMG